MNKLKTDSPTLIEGMCDDHCFAATETQPAAHCQAAHLEYIRERGGDAILAGPGETGPGTEGAQEETHEPAESDGSGSGDDA